MFICFFYFLFFVSGRTSMLSERYRDIHSLNASPCLMSNITTVTVWMLH